MLLLLLKYLMMMMIMMLVLVNGVDEIVVRSRDSGVDEVIVVRNWLRNPWIR